MEKIVLGDFNGRSYEILYKDKSLKKKIIKVNQWELPIFDLEIEVWLLLGQTTTIQKTIPSHTSMVVWHTAECLKAVNELFLDRRSAIHLTETICSLTNCEESCNAKDF